MKSKRSTWRAATLLASGAWGIIAALAPAAASAAAAESTRPYPVTEQRAPCNDFDPLRRPHFGDTHVHTAFSFDASAQDTRNTPADAYRFARGEVMGIQPYDKEGRPLRTLKLDRPLDFTAVTDHAELLGEVNICMSPETPGYRSVICWLHRNWPSLAFKLIPARSVILKSRWGICGKNDALCSERNLQVWQQTQADAEAAYDRSPACRFTSFVGYEWTATVGQGDNLHRNVIFRNERVPERTVSWLDTKSAADLWDQLEAKCVEGVPGCDVLTIPHNSNLSAGLMFRTASLYDYESAEQPMGVEEARRRARWEPLVEVMQHKGDSECRLGGASEDELCGFEKMEYDRFGAKFSFMVEKKAPGPPNFIRWALGQGLVEEKRLGANPFKFGLIASTDTHIAAPGLTAEKRHPGHGGAGIGAGGGVPVGFPDDFEFSPGGLAVLWAEENTRDSLFAAMQRREAYGTSGTRPVLRFFGGWDYPEDMCESGGFVEQGYAGGVPMGGDLPATSRGGPPRFALWSLQDPGTPSAPGTPLQRIQIVKGWLEGDELREKVIDVAGGENGATVDLATCEPQGKGASSLCSVWSDPDFDPKERAFYYARVVENPTCRWSQYVCNEAKVDCNEPDSVPEGLTGCCSPEHRPAIQERAWSSPIWYSP